MSRSTMFSIGISSVYATSSPLLFPFHHLHVPLYFPIYQSIVTLELALATTCPSYGRSIYNLLKTAMFSPIDGVSSFGCIIIIQNDYSNYLITNNFIHDNAFWTNVGPPLCRAQHAYLVPMCTLTQCNNKNNNNYDM